MPDHPEKSYGVLMRDEASGPVDRAADQILRLGYAVVDPGFSEAETAEIAARFDAARAAYTDRWGLERLRAADEHNGIRQPMAIDRDTFAKLALSPRILEVVGRLIRGQFILNQQNGVINPSGEGYNQGQWHRDLPYQHFVSSAPLAINALYCVDDFTVRNGSTWVLPATHKSAAFPSAEYLAQHAIQIEARAGQFIVLDCMLYHSGGFNRSGRERRAVNHVYTIPYFSQQIRIPGNIAEDGLSAEGRRILGFGAIQPQSVEEYLASRGRK
jgi:ectoine hydroxylase-related dioxygenase (phytanoyl-CoA dioxygenase family)